MPAKIELNEEQVEDLALNGYTVPMIAAHFRCSSSTIYERFGDLIADARLKFVGTVLQEAVHQAKKDSKVLLWLLDNFVEPVINEQKRMSLRTALETLKDALAKPGSTIDGVLAEAREELSPARIAASRHLLR